MTMLWFSLITTKIDNNNHRARRRNTTTNNNHNLFLLSTPRLLVWLFAIATLLLLSQCGQVNAMLPRSLTRSGSLRSASLSNRSKSMRSTGGALTRLERAAEQYGLSAADLSLFKYEARLFAQINELSKEIHLCENTMIGPDLLTRTHQLAKNALVVSIAYDDLLNNIYPELEANLKDISQEMEVTERYKQEYVGQMTNNNRNLVPFEQRQEYNEKLTEFATELKKNGAKKAYLERCIDEMRSDYGLIEDASKRGLTIVDIQKRAEGLEKPSLYQEKFAAIIKERRTIYAKKAELLARRYKEGHEPVSELNAIEPFAAKPLLTKPPLPPSTSRRWGSSSGAGGGGGSASSSSASVKKQVDSIRSDAGRGSNGKPNWVPPANVNTAEVRPDGALQYKLKNGDTWEIVVGQVWIQENGKAARRVDADYAEITAEYFNELKRRI